MPVPVKSMYSLDMVGRTLMHYKVVGELGAGGMGVVYEALDLRLDRRVALKILPADKTDDQQRRARFLHEARTASALNDPHIVTIFDIFTVDDTDVLVMELVPGRTLREILGDGPMPLAKALDVALQVAEGVGTAHTAGIVHRDLKPGNVMVSERGRVKVLDFGLAKLVGGESLADRPTTLAPATLAGMLVGTVDYMSPEQARGDPIDARSDVFSLGAMLYEMIAGARPFTSGHALGVLHEIAYGAIVPVRARRPDATADIERIVLRALERDVTRRYQTMEAFINDLRRAHRDVVADAPTAADTPVPVLVPPPLPPHAAQPTVDRSDSTHTPLPPPSGSTVVQSGSMYTPLPAPSGSSSPFKAIPLPRGIRRGRRHGRRVRKGRSFWKTVGIVIAIVFMINWMRTWMSDTPRGVSGPRGTRGAQPPELNDIGKTIEDTVASGLLRFGSGSAEIQFASAKIYWKRAQDTKDPESVKKAEDAFNEALRLGLKDASDEREARDALRQIAALKTPTGEAPTGDESSPRPATDARDPR
jgi:serine/threonine protein kinase